MRILVTLSLLQTVGVAAVVVLLLQDRDHPAIPSESIAVTENSAAGRIASATVEDQRTELRELIRAEIAASKAGDGAAPKAPSPARDVSSEQRQREAVAQQIETYRSIGTISDTQMQELQADIVALDEASRGSMMSALVRAMNAGEIKGHF